MNENRTPEAIIRNHFAELGRKGAKARAKRYSHAQLSKWAQLGGRPAKKKAAEKQKGKPKQ